MGKRLTCSRCNATNEHDVPAIEATAPQREVRCRACGHRFVYGYAPEFVTEAEATPREGRSSDGAFDASVEIPAARDRLTRHVARYSEYADRDRDLLLLYQLDLAERVAEDLAAIRRTLDVIVKRWASK